MKFYQLWLIILKLAMAIQVGLILGNKQTEDHVVYLLTDLLFKTSLGIFLIFYFYINGAPKISGLDELFIGFGGALLIFDAWYDVFPKILEKYGIYFNPYTLRLSKAPSRDHDAS
jgi:hypothetical protein